MDGTHPTEMHSCYNLFLKNYLMINYQATRNLLGHPDLQSWVPGWATAKKFLNHRLEHLFNSRRTPTIICLIVIHINLCMSLYNVEF